MHVHFVISIVPFALVQSFTIILAEKDSSLSPPKPLIVVLLIPSGFLVSNLLLSAPGLGSPASPARRPLIDVVPSSAALPPSIAQKSRRDLERRAGAAVLGSSLCCAPRRECGLHIFSPVEPKKKGAGDETVKTHPPR